VPELYVTDRWWVIHEAELVEALLRVEADEITAAEAHAILLEHTTQEPVDQ
jgi:hypothetical protein